MNTSFFFLQRGFEQLTVGEIGKAGYSGLSPKNVDQLLKDTLSSLVLGNALDNALGFLSIIMFYFHQLCTLYFIY